MVCATHTHAAPSIVSDMFEACIVDETYVVKVSDACKSVLRSAVADARPARLDYGAGATNIGINRRRKISTPSLRHPGFTGRIANRPNSGGANDGKVYVLRVSRENSIPLYVVAGACHPSIIRSANISADYPGLIRENMSNFLGADVDVMFLQGFAGNLRARLLLDEPFKLWPPAALRRFVFDRHKFKTDTSETEAGLIAAQFARNALAVQLKESPGTDIESSVEDLDIRLDGARDIEEIMESNATPAEIRQRVLSFLEGIGSEPGINLNLQHLKVGEINFVALNAEVFTEYAIALEQFSDRFVIPVGYANGMIGYLPDSAGLQEGGYEPDRSRVLFGIPSRFSTNTEQAVHAKFRRMLGERPI
jgi:hypothetical protein